MTLRAGQCVAQPQGDYNCPQEGALWSCIASWPAKSQIEEIE